MNGGYPFDPERMRVAEMHGRCPPSKVQTRSADTIGITRQRGCLSFPNRPAKGSELYEEVSYPHPRRPWHRFNTNDKPVGAPAQYLTSYNLLQSLIESVMGRLRPLESESGSTWRSY